MASNQIVPGEHPNYDVQLPANLTNDTGITFQDLATQDPQYDFAFSNDLVLYFNPINPAKQVIVTTPAMAWIPDIGPPSAALLQTILPVVVILGPVPTCATGGICITIPITTGVVPDCHTTGMCPVVTPPVVETPEVPTGFVGCVLPLLWWAKRKK